MFIQKKDRTKKKKLRNDPRQAFKFNRVLIVSNDKELCLVLQDKSRENELL